MAEKLLKVIDNAREEGLDINFDQYPYTAWSTGLIEIFPPWAKEKGNTALIRLLGDPSTRKKIAAEMHHPPDTWDNPMEGLGWDMIRLMGMKQPSNAPLNGWTVKHIAARMKIDPVDAIIDLYVQEHGGLSMIVFAMSESDLTAILRHPAGMIGSDGSSITPGGPAGYRSTRGFTAPFPGCCPDMSAKKRSFPWKRPFAR
jgi:N-acyl-D-amino-acid deacylase